MKDSNWIVSGIIAAVCFAFSIFILDMPRLLGLGLSCAVFIGGLFMFKPSKVIIHGIDITKAAKKSRAESTVNIWVDLTDKLKTFKTDNAYLKIKTAQLLDDANSVFYKINADINALYCAEKFLDRYLSAGIALCDKYNRADEAEASVSSGNYADVKQKVRDKLERILDFFRDNFLGLTDNDVRIITEFTDLIKEITDEN